MPTPSFSRLAAVALGGLFISCEPPKEAAPYRTSTAAEIFDLRSKCAVLGEKILADNFIGSALAQEQVSHYDPQTNRCYVKLEVHTADLAAPQDRFKDHTYLYDGQTHEMLVWATRDEGRKSGYITDGFAEAKPGHPVGVLASYDDASALIDKYMADDRKR
jgi:hypothetical protein